MNVVLLGAGGMLARAVERSAPAGIALRALTQADLDITDAAAVDRELATRPDWVINCAAWTQVDAAEEHEAEATLVNGTAVGGLGRVAAAHGVRVLHISTDYVFDGLLGRAYREDDAPNPQGGYGRSKLVGERELLMVDGGGWMVVRTQWLYGGGPSFVRTMWRKGREGARARVVDDQFGAPTHVSELARVIWRLVGEGAEGVWHAAAGGSASWFEVARAVYASAGANPELVTPCSTAEFGAKATRPAFGVLDCSKLGAMRPWNEVLAESLATAVRTGEAP